MIPDCQQKVRLNSENILTILHGGCKNGFVGLTFQYKINNAPIELLFLFNGSV